jgi:uncharacterized protein (TIGR02996 family)
MNEEDGFVAAILADPRDDTPRLVFADWLEERGDPRGEFLRISLRLEALFKEDPPEEMRAKVRRVREIAKLQKRLRELREIVPLDWALKLFRGSIECCGYELDDGTDCPGRWEALPETDDPTVRRCSSCIRTVWFCWSTAEVRQALSSGHPVVKAMVLDRE